MRAAAVAFVLVVGAAVVLWFGNTLNSWVLGGLIGGLAALLLSIPISLSLFSFLSRRHDDRFRTEIHEQMSLGQTYSYALPPAGAQMRGYQLPPQASEAYREEYELDEDYQEYEEIDEAEGVYEESSTLRRSSSMPLSSRQSSLSSRELSAPSHSVPLKQRNSALYPAIGAEQTRAPRSQVQRLTPSHLRSPYPGLPRGQGGLRQSQYLSEALRAARLETVRRRDDDPGRLASGLEQEDIEVSSMLPPPPPGLAARRSSALSPRSSSSSQQRRPRPSQSLQRGAGSRSSSFAPEDEEALTGPYALSQREREAYVDEENPWDNRLQRQSGQMPLSPRSADASGFYSRQSSSVARSRITGDQRRVRGLPSGSLKNPLVRRAPYMYEDDPLREELGQYIDEPVTRRSSLYRRYQEHDDSQP